MSAGAEQDLRAGLAALKLQLDDGQIRQLLDYLDLAGDIARQEIEYLACRQHVVAVLLIAFVVPRLFGKSGCDGLGN